MLQSNGIMDRVPCQSVQTNNFSFAFAVDGNGFAPAADSRVLRQSDGGSARRVFFVDVVHLPDVRVVAWNLGEDAGCLFSNQIQGVNTWEPRCSRPEFDC